MPTSHATPGDALGPAGARGGGGARVASRRRRVMNLQVPSHGCRLGDAPEAPPSQKRWSGSGGVGRRRGADPAGRAEASLSILPGSAAANRRIVTLVERSLYGSWTSHLHHDP